MARQHSIGLDEHHRKRLASVGRHVDDYHGQHSDHPQDKQRRDAGEPMPRGGAHPTGTGRKRTGM